MHGPDDHAGDFGGGNDLGPIAGGLGWALACAYTLGALTLVCFAVELIGEFLSLIASVIGP